MGLSRLDNFLKNSRGDILYVDPSSIDSTDSIENQGNSLARPFKTIQRALIEAARFSYQRGLDNDRFGRTTIVVYPGEHVIDNRPGWIPIHDAPLGGNNWRQRNGGSSNGVVPFNLDTNFDINSDDNDLYKLNSVYGGVIIPRGTSIVGMDLRKTKIRAKFIPDPSDNTIDRTAIFRVTGSCYFYQFTFFDADPNGQVFKNYGTGKFVPNFSHHKLTCFEYADGTNPVKFNDSYLTYSTSRTDLDIYYNKIGLLYGPSSGRDVTPDYPSTTIDIQAKVDEYRIVGSKGQDVGITSIRAGNGSLSSTLITVNISEPVNGIDVDTPISISGVPAAGYNGQFVVNAVQGPTTIQYKVSSAPINPLPTIVSGSPTLSIAVDTVTSSSPYIFNCSLRSVFGMCGLHADGNKSDGFKSMVVAQFTGIGLQKDDNAFVKYNPVSGVYEDATSVSNIHKDSLAKYKPEYENYHIKSSNDSFLQLVSVFAIGYANHFVVESGGDHSITNSNSNFGAKAIVARGFRTSAFSRDDSGYITHIIPPQEIQSREVTIEFGAIDVVSTVGVGSTTRLYLYNENNLSNPPNHILEGYRIGARKNDILNVGIGATTLQARIVMPNTQNTGIFESSYRKIVHVGRSTIGINSISANTFTFTTPHTFINGESVRILSNDGELPDGLTHNQVYYAITNGLNPDQLKLAQTFNDTISGDAISINNKGGQLIIESRVSDKVSGDIGHPIQYDNNYGQWYITVSGITTYNTFYPGLVGLGTAVIGRATPRTYIKRIPDTRSLQDKIYRARYVIPKDTVTVARPPQEGYVLQESNKTTGTTTAEILKFGSVDAVTISNSSELRNFKLVSNAAWNPITGIASYTTETPHELSIGSLIQVNNVTSTTNSTGVGNSGFNGAFIVASVDSRRQFSVGIATNPGTFTNNTSLRTTSLPYVQRLRTASTLVVYKSTEIQEYVPNKKDGIYHLTVVNTSNSPNVAPFTGLKFSQPLKNLYPQLDRDNPISDPPNAVSYALPDFIGQVEVNNPEYSITKETLGRVFLDFSLGIGITDIQSSSGTAHTVYTRVEHGLNRITRVGIVSTGLNYGNGSGSSQTLYNARLVGFAGSVTGNFATANVKIDGSGRITDVRIIDGGSAYGIGNTLAVVGVATTAGHIVGVVSVTQIYNNINDCLDIQGVQTDVFKTYNGLYRITDVQVGQTNRVNVSSASTVTADFEFFGNFPIVGVNTSGLAAINSQIVNFSTAYVSGKAIGISSVVYNSTVGVASVTTAEPHGLKSDNRIVLSGFDSDFYNGTFLISKINGVSSFDITLGITTNVPLPTGSAFLLKPGFGSNGGFITKDNERTSGRIVTEYAGITTTLSAALTNPNVNVLTITNALNRNFQVGDYLLVDNEIMRISQTVTNNTSVNVFRGLFGSSKDNHPINSVVTRIKLRPIEFRRNSIIRASGHTFEYLGFGPGNYSTALPERQDRKFTDTERILSQSVSDDGGAPIYNGLDDSGNLYTINKFTNSSTGQDLLVKTPIPTVRGEDITSDTTAIGYDIQSTDVLTVTKGIKVEGGDGGNVISEFNGPIVINKKLTSNSEDGIEANSLYLQGETIVSRKYTVGITTPFLAGNAGDVVFNSSPDSGDTLGWVYTSDNYWQEFGPIKSAGTQRYCGIWSGVFIGDGSQLSNVTDIWVFDGVGISTTAFVGVGTNSARNGYALYSGGSVLFEGTTTFQTQAMVWNVPNGFLVNTGITTFNQQLNANTFRAVGVSTFQNDIVLTTNPATTGDTLGNYLRFVQTDTNITSAYRYGGITWEGNDTGNSGIRGYIYGVSEGSNGQFGISFGTQGSGASNPTEQMKLGSDGNLTVTGEVTALSDAKLKKNVKTIDDALNKVLQLRGVEFDRIDIETHQIGVIAQEIEQILPEVVHGTDTKSVSYANIVPVLIEAIKEQQKQIDAQAKQIEELIKRLDG